MFDIIENNPTLSNDMLVGAGDIAAFVFGNAGHRRKVYYLAEAGVLPIFRLGSVICARRTTLLAWINDQESRRAA